MYRVSVIGANGYAGAELTRLLTSHKEIKIAHLISRSNAGKRISSLYPNLRGICDIELEGDFEAAASDSDVIFAALPHKESMSAIPFLLSQGAKVIDLSGDFRYDDAAVYEEWYGAEHTQLQLLSEAVYGLCELHRDAISKARLIGNPGCYTTCSILALAPLVKSHAIDISSIIIDAKSGATGAGRSPSAITHFCELDQNVRAYSIATHRHTSEIEQELSKLSSSPVALSFSPHLIPVKRGILSTCYATLSRPATRRQLYDMFLDMYKNEPFVDVYEDGLPELKHVCGSNKCAIGFVIDERLNRVVVVSAIDNLIKGAAGQAIQNMNIMLGFDETCGLEAAAYYL
ncbi:MAG: N-acetyl-gamma-glutamyl-phosphate reductase [Christensenellales bacterium]|jgi:N-acetyl-gamma-glutamyl-phosphate reductase